MTPTPTPTPGFSVSVSAPVPTPEAGAPVPTPASGAQAGAQQAGTQQGAQAGIAAAQQGVAAALPNITLDIPDLTASDPDAASAVQQQQNAEMAAADAIEAQIEGTTPTKGKSLWHRADGTVIDAPGQVNLAAEARRKTGTKQAGRDPHTALRSSMWPFDEDPCGAAMTECACVPPPPPAPPAPPSPPSPPPCKTLAEYSNASPPSDGPVTCHGGGGSCQVPVP